MDHLVILKKEWKLLELILSGEKTIESRWYLQKRDPWDKINAGDILYLKNTGERASAAAEVESVLQFEDLNAEKVKKLLKKYGKGIGIPKEKQEEFFHKFKEKKRCILVFIKNPKKIKPFKINKEGSGLMNAWICIKDINQIRKPK